MGHGPNIDLFLIFRPILKLVCESDCIAEEKEWKKHELLLHLLDANTLLTA